MNRSTLEGGNGHPLQYSCLEKPMDREAWQVTVQRVAKSWTQLSTHAREHSGRAERKDALQGWHSIYTKDLTLYSLMKWNSWNTSLFFNFTPSMSICHSYTHHVCICMCVYISCIQMANRHGRSEILKKNYVLGASLVAQTLKHLPAMRET